jgi:CheY-like chemotaxis protein
MAAKRGDRAENPGFPRSAFVPLLVEDDADQALLMVRAFVRAKVRAPLAIMKTREEAVAYLSGGQPFQDRVLFPMPTLVLLDIRMPKMSGLEVLKWIREQPSLARLHVLMLSSLTDPMLVSRAYSLGADGYFPKGPGFAALLDVVKWIEVYWAKHGEKSGAWRFRRRN